MRSFWGCRGVSSGFESGFSADDLTSAQPFGGTGWRGACLHFVCTLRSSLTAPQSCALGLLSLAPTPVAGPLARSPELARFGECFKKVGREGKKRTIDVFTRRRTVRRRVDNSAVRHLLNRDHHLTYQAGDLVMRAKRQTREAADGVESADRRLDSRPSLAWLGGRMSPALMPVSGPNSIPSGTLHPSGLCHPKIPP